ncbi:hypothetical protein D3C86_806680 [compost metagenome]
MASINSAEEQIRKTRPAPSAATSVRLVRFSALPPFAVDTVLLNDDIHTRLSWSDATATALSPDSLASITVHTRVSTASAIADYRLAAGAALRTAIIPMHFCVTASATDP